MCYFFFFSERLEEVYTGERKGLGFSLFNTLKDQQESDKNLFHDVTLGKGDRPIEPKSRREKMIREYEDLIEFYSGAQI